MCETSNHGIMKDLRNNDTYGPILHHSLNWANISRIRDDRPSPEPTDHGCIHMQRDDTDTHLNALKQMFLLLFHMKIHFFNDLSEP